MPVHTRKASRVHAFLLTAALALYWLMAVSVSPRMGVTGDEVVHITGGYSYWTFNDYRLHPENGNLAQRIAALPLVFMHLQFPSLADPDWKTSKVNLVGEKFFFHEGNPVAAMLLAARMMIALVGTFAVWLTWRWARGLFGVTAGWLALVLAVFSPTMLAHGGLATSDMVMTACALGALTAYWRLLHRASWLRLAMAAVACGLAFLAKMSGVIIVPVIAILLVIRCLKPTPLVLAFGRTRWMRGSARWGWALGLTLITAVGSLVVLWAGFGFRYAGSNPHREPASSYYFSWGTVLSEEPAPVLADTSLNQLWPESAPPRQNTLDHLIIWLRGHQLLPEAYLWGFAQTERFSRYRQAYLMGEYRTTGWVQFFPTAFLLKTTLASLALGLAGLLVLVKITAPSRKTHARPWVYRAAPLLVFFIIYWAAALTMNLNIGHRHILPIYPVFHVLTSAVVLWPGLRHSRTALAALVIATGLHVGDSIRARPFYLSYFQPLCGGMERGYRYLVDSSLDWGQGLPDLELWLGQKAARGDRTPTYLSYFGADSARARKLNVIRFGDNIYDSGPRYFPAQLHAGWYVISATNFTQTYSPVRGDWTQQHARLYDHLQQEMLTLSARPSATDQDRQQLLQDCMDLELMQTARLCSYLKNRQPLEMIGGSLLVFKLTETELQQALHGG